MIDVSFILGNRLALGIVALCFWTALYLASNLVVNRLTKDLSLLSRVIISESAVSSIQGLICGGIGIVTVLQCKHEVLKALYPPVIHYCTIAAGYFVYDLAVIYRASIVKLTEKNALGSFRSNFVFYLKNNSVMIAHHVLLTALCEDILCLHADLQLMNYSNYWDFCCCFTVTIFVTYLLLLLFISFPKLLL